MKETSVVSQIVGSSTAQAQSSAQAKRKSLLSILFGRRDVKKKAVKKRNLRSKTKRRTKKKTRRGSSRTRKARTSESGNTTSRASAVAAVAKSPDAKKILVVGDFFAGGLADGLEEAFKGVPNLVVVEKSNGLSGFVREDVVNWPERLGVLIEEIKPQFIVAMLGSNDRQLLRSGGKKLNKRTAEWDTAYNERVQELGAALKNTGTPFIWVGLPPVRFKTMNKDFLFFNELYRKASNVPNGQFIDVWDGFSDADGNYSRSGPDIDGQIVLLRPKDGINLTKAGKRRLAFYIENQIRRSLIGGELFLNPSASFDPLDNLPQPARYDPKSTGKTIVIRLDDPTIDGAETLAGEKVIPGGNATGAFEIPTTPQPNPVVRKEGRVDDYTWPPANTIVTSPAAVAVSN